MPSTVAGSHRSVVDLSVSRSKPSKAWKGNPKGKGPDIYMVHIHPEYLVYPNPLPSVLVLGSNHGMVSPSRTSGEPISVAGTGLQARACRHFESPRFPVRIRFARCMSHASRGHGRLSRVGSPQMEGRDPEMNTNRLTHGISPFGRIVGACFLAPN